MLNLRVGNSLTLIHWSPANSTRVHICRAFHQSKELLIWGRCHCWWFVRFGVRKRWWRGEFRNWESFICRGSCSNIGLDARRGFITLLERRYLLEQRQVGWGKIEFSLFLHLQHIINFYMWSLIKKSILTNLFIYPINNQLTIN